MTPTDGASAVPVRIYLMELQDRICAALEAEEPRAVFSLQEFRDDSGSLSQPRVMSDGEKIEKAAVNFSNSIGSQLPAAASERRPELAGRAFEAVSLSLIIHPRNPYAPTTHMNIRFFVATQPDAEPVWWFGGGFDLTPYYGFEQDCVEWHRTARDACAEFGEGLYERLKKNCDDFFYLPHRADARGIGGLFFDDFSLEGFEQSFEFLRSVGDHFLMGYLPLLRRRVETPFGDNERAFQKQRRGRYVEFNLLYDRGTRYGLQSGRRIESVLASLPPEVSWSYEFEPEPGSPEASLIEDFLRPHDWLDRGA